MRTLLVTALALPLAALSGCAGGACSCDIIDTESTCVEFTAPDNPLYATQLSATCNNTLQSLCDSLGGVYEMGTACVTTDLVADCEVDNFNFVQTTYWYSVGGDPMDPTSTEPDEDCASNGVVNRY